MKLSIAKTDLIVYVFVTIKPDIIGKSFLLVFS